ncbi:uncharacterized protein LOC144700791 isoform X2 [Wolffia australiana]
MKTQARRCTCWGIPYYSTEDESFFQGCGTVTELDCMIFRENGKFTGIAIVSFKMEAATKRALALGCSDRSWWEGRGCICLQMLTPRRQHRSEGPEAWVRGVDLEGQPGEGGCELHLAGYHHEPPRAVWQRVRAGAGLPHVTHRRKVQNSIAVSIDFKTPLKLRRINGRC